MSWIFPGFAVAAVALFLIILRVVLHESRSGFIGGDFLLGLMFILVAGAPLTLLWFMILQVVQKLFDRELPEGAFVVSFVMIGCLQWLIWSQVAAFILLTFVSI